MDFEKINLKSFPQHCRTCLNKFQGFKQKVGDLPKPLLQLLKQSFEESFSELDWSHNDIYPDGICHKCCEKLESFYIFQTTCKKTKQFLDKLISAQSIIPTTNVKGNIIGEVDLVPATINSIIKSPEKEKPLLHEEIVLKVDIEDLFHQKINTKKRGELLKNISPSKALTIKDVIVNESENKNNCKVCQKSYSSLTALKRHMLNHAALRPFSCDICTRGFNAKCQLVRHREEHSTTKIVCKFNCGQTFDRTHKAEWHYRMNHKHNVPFEKQKSIESLYICEECGKPYKTRRSLNDHRNSHLPEEQRPYKCDQCNKRFASSSDLKVHVMRHNGTRNFQCSHCGKKKTTARELRLHISNIHTKDRQVRCDLCSKMFLNPGCLKRHQKVVHFGYKKFKCSYCDETFGAADTLKYHERRHTGEKPHQCNICGHSFIQPYALKKHLNTHNASRECL